MTQKGKEGEVLGMNSATSHSNLPVNAKSILELVKSLTSKTPPIMHFNFKLKNLKNFQKIQHNL